MLKFRLLLGLSMLLTLASCSAKQTTSTKETEKPNVIVVITDDQGYGDLACHGNPMIQTPNIDKFYSESVRLTNFHVGTTCAPTRGGVMSGRNCNRNGTWHTIGGCSMLHERETTLANIFADNGYATVMFGKWHLGDNYPFRPHDRGFQDAFYHGAGGVGQTPDYWGNDYFDDTYFRNGKPEKVEGYCTDVWFNEATKYIDAHQKNPFFMYLSLNAPHGPYNVDEKYVSLYDDAPLLDKQKRFYGMITQLDERFGMLNKHLEELGIADNTMVIFMTDNGTAAGYSFDKKDKKTYGFNAGMKGTKGSNFDGGHRVPFFIKWPKGNITGGKDVSDLTAHVDIMPTLVDLCGFNTKFELDMDGISIRDLIYGTESKVDFKNRMLVTDTQRIQWPEKGRNSCVMMDTWRLIGGEKLYNVADDIGQENDLAAQYPEKVAAMKAFYDEWWSRAEKDFEYPAIKIGTEYENPAHLCCHDMHTTEAIPWNQDLIRKGVAFQEGYLLTQVVNPGKYKISISRYPQESGLKIDAVVPGVAATKGTEEISDGVSLTLTKPFVSINGNNVECKFNEEHTAAVVEVELEAGELKLAGGFMDQDNKPTRAYYYVVEKL